MIEAENLLRAAQSERPDHIPVWMDINNWEFVMEGLFCSS
jgi:hypothetical protein